MKNLCLPIEKEGQPTAGLVSDVLLSKENFCPPKRCLDLTFDTIIIGQKGQKPLWNAAFASFLDSEGVGHCRKKAE